MLASLSALGDRERLVLELEFVQNLCNAKYLHYLAQNRFLQDEKFLIFLRYLRYWKEPQYMRRLAFPQCLAFLDALIDDESFRKELTVAPFADFVHQQQGSHWLVDMKEK